MLYAIYRLLSLFWQKGRGTVVALGKSPNIFIKCSFLTESTPQLFLFSLWSWLFLLFDLLSRWLIGLIWWPCDFISINIVRFDWHVIEWQLWYVSVHSILKVYLLVTHLVISYEILWRSMLDVLLLAYMSFCMLILNIFIHRCRSSNIPLLIMWLFIFGTTDPDLMISLVERLQGYRFLFIYWLLYSQVYEVLRMESGVNCVLLI